MRKKRTLLLVVLVCSINLLFSQADVYVNMNMVHWVDTVSDFGRDRHLVMHADPTEDDWQGEADKLDYLINECDVYFGRDNGYSSWYAGQTPQDENNPHYFDYDWMIESGGPAIKTNYSQLAKRTQGHQFRNKGNMIMGTNPQPLYPSLGTDAGLGWLVTTTEASAKWQGVYLDNYFSKGEGDAGMPIPTYWEIVNEIDMVMNLHGSYLITSYETVWRYHNQSAQEIRKRLGDKAPRIGGMTWGLHDFHRGDGITNRALGVASDKTAGYSWSAYEDMYLDTDLERNNYMTDWYQWDNYWQGFMDHCGDQMDFHSVHMYDWPEYDNDDVTIRTGGHVEGMLDMIEWYDIKMGSGTPKEIVISEYGAVAGVYNAGLAGHDDRRRDWENLKPFNAMLMQFLERPNTIRLTSQFTPVKAHWGDTDTRYPYKMLDNKVDENEHEWTDFVKFYELWSDVDGTRVETKSTDIDVQVDAYVDGNHMYIILNNMQEVTKTLDMHYYNNDAVAVENVFIKTLWLDESISEGVPTLTENTVKTLPGQIELKPDATIILDVTFASPLDLDQTCREYKIMGERIGTGTTDAGGQKFTVDTKAAPTQTMTIKGVPALSGSDEAILRVTGSFYNSPGATFTVKVNGKSQTPSKFYRGEPTARHFLRLGAIEVPVPAGDLNEGDNTVEVSYNSTAGFAVCQLQYWKFSEAPGRGTDNIAVTDLTLPSALALEVGEESSLAAVIAPANASDKTITWSSDNSSVTVDKLGVLKAVSTGSATITATCGGQTKTCTVTVNPYSPVSATGVSIEGAPVLNLEHRKFDRLQANVTPADASIKSVTWSVADEDVAMVYENGMIDGLTIGGSTTVTVTVVDEANHSHQALITVNVGVAGNEYITSAGIPDTVSAGAKLELSTVVNVSEARNVKLELLSGTTVIGTGTASVSTTGISLVPVTIDNSSVPSTGQYTVKSYLLNGSSEIAVSEEPLYIEAIEPDSIAVADWLWEMKTGGSTIQIQATVFPEDAYNKTINWSTNDAAKATVNANGLVTSGSSAGIVTITGTTEVGSIVKTIDIDIKDVFVVEATDISINELVTVFPGTTHELQLVFDPEWTTDKDITWTVTNESVVKVTSGNTFEVLGAEGSQTTISGVYNADNSVTVSTTVKVSDVIYIESEDFIATDGSYNDDADATAQYPNIAGPGVNPHATGINFVNTGDWATYSAYFPESGLYNITFYAGTATDITDGIISIKLNGQSLGTATAINQGWDNYQPVSINGVYIEKGNHDIRLDAIGGSLYQWNMEHFEFEMAGPILVTGIEVLPEEWALLNGTTKMLSANVLPLSATDKSFTWSSDATSVATVNATTGLVTAEGLGTANIIAVSTDGSFKDTCVVEVKSQILVESIEVNPATVNLSAGNTKDISVTILPEYAADPGVSWSTDDSGVATVSNGVITAVANGNTTITVTANDGSGVSQTIAVTVAPVLVKRVSILPSSATISVGSTIALNSVIVPDNADNKNVSWSSDNEDAATVSADGVVTGRGVGIATITVTTQDGNKTNTCSVTVEADPTSVSDDLQKELAIYPNPVSESFRIDGNENEVYNVRVFTTHGELIMQLYHVMVSENISVSDLASGMYILHLEGENDYKVLKFYRTE